MRPTPLALVAAALSLCFAQAALAQQTYTSVAGPWWFTIAGKDKGAILLQFSSPSAGAFAVQDLTLTDPQEPTPSFGFSRSLASFFVIAAGQGLNFDANGDVVGDLDLSDPSDSSHVGTLSIERGKPNSAFTTLGLRATIDGAAVRLKAVRPPDAFPVLTGRTTTGQLHGKKLMSKAIDLRATTFGDLGPPAYAWSAKGPVSGEPSDVALTGHIMLTPSFKAWGLLEDSDTFEPGTVNGSLQLEDPNSTVPTLRLTVQTVPKLKLKGQLIEATEPVLSVTPQSFDFGSVALDGGSSEHTFAVSNVGVGSLSGSAQFLIGTPIDFSASGDTTYTALEPSDPPAQVDVSFAPQTAGPQTAQLRFGVSSGVGAKLVTVTGCGGVAEIDVTPSGTIPFPSTTVATSATPITVTVKNIGACPLTGAATLATATVFRLIPLASVVPQDSIAYTVAPDASTQFRILFTPTASGDAEDDLTLTGGQGATVHITGTGTPP